MISSDRRAKLHAFVETWREREHEYGVNDCALFAASWVAALHGIDPVAELRGIYSTESEADELLEQLGGFEVAVPQRLLDIGVTPVRFEGGLNARVGDIVLGMLPTHYAEDGTPTESRPCLAICNGETAIVPSDKGVTSYRINRFGGGWHV